MNSRYAVMLAGLAAMAFATPSFALEGCTCAGMALNGAKVLGTVDAASGAVTLDGAKAQAGMVLKNGSTIATGKEGSANLSVSGCSVPMTAASSVSVSQTGPDVCVKLVKNGKLVTSQQFAGVLPGEQEGASSQQGNIEVVNQNDMTVTVRRGSLREFQFMAWLNGVTAVGATAYVVGGVVTRFIEDPACVSNCG